MKTMTTDEAGCFLKAQLDEFNRQLDQLGPHAFTKKVRQTLQSGFQDGARTVLFELERTGYVQIDRSAK